MGKKKVAVLSKAQLSAVRKKKEGVRETHLRYCPVRGWYEVDFAAELERRRPGKPERRIQEAREAMPRNVGDRYRRARVTRILERLANTRPRLLDPPYVRVVLALGYVPNVNPLEGWSPSGKGSRAALRSLFQHLVGPFRTPDFLIDSLMTETLGPDGIELQVQVADAVANGKSLYKIQASLFAGVGLTRRMCHILVNTPGERPLVPAIRRAQVLGFGGDKSLARQLGRGFFSRLRPDEGFWSEVIHWLCRQETIDFVQIDPICDYLQHVRGEDRGFSLKGRNWRSVLRRMQQWHVDLALANRLRSQLADSAKGRARTCPRDVFRRSGFQPANGTEMVKNDGKKAAKFAKRVTRQSQKVNWSIREILLVDDLVAEGRAMHHCVSIHAPHIRTGARSIWSLVRDGKRALTIEVANREQLIVQVRGKANRMPVAREMANLRVWAGRNDLKIDRGY